MFSAHKLHVCTAINSNIQFLLDCYYGVGFGYHGNVNVTRSGRMCQSWKSQCPQRHWQIPKDVVKSKNDSNLCHNPDSSAPDGPWCYTTDPNVRWEYCNISRFPPRGKVNKFQNQSWKKVWVIMTVVNRDNYLDYTVAIFIRLLNAFVVVLSVH